MELWGVRKRKLAATKPAEIVTSILRRANLSHKALAHHLGSSLVEVVRWERGDTEPNAQMLQRLQELLSRIDEGVRLDDGKPRVFASRGLARSGPLPLFNVVKAPELTKEPLAPIRERLSHQGFWGAEEAALAAILSAHAEPAPTLTAAAEGSISAGKNTYTYDAHTYHTKVPPQGIAEVLTHYLPEGGLVLDPFSGSGMTGVAARCVGLDVILNELSPAASFISDRFTSSIDPDVFAAGVNTICHNLRDLRRDLYETTCRECGKNTEILFTVWSYRVRCHSCDTEFLLWDHCRKYGQTVREHKILNEFSCPSCATILKKSRLARTEAEPVLVGYKCCTRQVERPLSEADRKKLKAIAQRPPVAEEFAPRDKIPDGVNLSQPKRHGLDSIDRFYTPRNFAAMSQLWRELHRVKDKQLAGFLAFAFTSLYQRVTRLSEFRFWGGSGNTARFNVPFIFNEANVFVTFERKARSIEDHLRSTASHYAGRGLVRTGSATDMSFLPSSSVDMIFTDPPFGANINYSEMNILWESWLRSFTETTNEAIVNRFQNKDVESYKRLMAESFSECFRVLRPGHWMVVVFMNSSQAVWKAIRDAITAAGFSLEKVDIFDKQHGTFKQFVSENTAGCDLLLHCRKTGTPVESSSENKAEAESQIISLLKQRRGNIPRVPYLHVRRDEEIDYRLLYSEYLAACLVRNQPVVDFAAYRSAAVEFLESKG